MDWGVVGTEVWGVRGDAVGMVLCGGRRIEMCFVRGRGFECQG